MGHPVCLLKIEMVRMVKNKEHTMTKVKKMKYSRAELEHRLREMAKNGLFFLVLSIAVESLTFTKSVFVSVMVLGIGFS